MTVFRTQLILNNNPAVSDIWKSFCSWTISTSYHKSEALVSFCKENSSKISPVKKTFPNNKEHSQEILEVFSVEGEELFYIIFTQKYENGNTYETKIVFNGLTERKALSYETNVFGEDEKRIKFTKSNFFDYLKPYIDKDALEKRFFTTAEIENFDVFAKIMKKGSDYTPFVYISMREDGTWPYTDEELNTLAEKLFCCAYVFKESDKKTSRILREQTSGANSYNGAVGIYVKNQRRIYFDMNINQITARITKLLCLNPVSENLTVNYVKNYFISVGKKALVSVIEGLFTELKKPENLEKFLQGLMGGAREKAENSKALEKTDVSGKIEEYRTKIAELEKSHQEEIANIREEYEKKIQDLEEWNTILEDDNKQQTEKIQNLFDENKTLTYQIESLKSGFSSSASSYQVGVNCSEKEVFPGEIKDYVKGLLFEGFKKRNEKPQSQREGDVAKILLAENTELDWEKSGSKVNYEKIKKEIASDGHSSAYSEVRHNGHHMNHFYGDSRYTLTEGSTLGDNIRGKKNLASCAEAHFLRPTSYR